MQRRNFKSNLRKQKETLRVSASPRRSAFFGKKRKKFFSSAFQQVARIQISPENCGNDHRNRASSCRSAGVHRDPGSCRVFTAAPGSPKRKLQHPALSVVPVRRQNREKVDGKCTRTYAGAIFTSCRQVAFRDGGGGKLAQNGGLRSLVRKECWRKGDLNCCGLRFWWRGGGPRWGSLKWLPGRCSPKSSCK